MTKTPEWQSAIEKLCACNGIVLVIGETDSGKTTFCTELANAAFSMGKRCAVVDSDIGQSDIGPPGTIGLGIIENQVSSLSEIKARRTYFIGDVTPFRHIVECVVGTKKMADEAKSLGAEIIIVDTTGFVKGVVGRRLKLNKAELLHPAYVAAIQRESESEHILQAFKCYEGFEIIRLKASSRAVTRPREIRAARRRLKFYEHFQGATEHKVRLDEVDCWNTWLGSGKTIPWQSIPKLSEILESRVLHAEVVGDLIYAVSASAADSYDIEELQRAFGVQNIIMASALNFIGILVGLADSMGNNIELGIVKRLDFIERSITVLSPISSVSPVRRIIFGTLRLAEDGMEIGRISKGEI